MVVGSISDTPLNLGALNEWTFNSAFNIFITFIRLIESTLALAANSLVLMAYINYPHIRQPTTCLICGLAVADMIGATLGPLVIMISLCRGTAAWVYVAHVKIFFQAMFSLGNILFSALIALERLLTLTYPLTCMTFITLNRTVGCVLAAFVYLTSVMTLISVASHSYISHLEQTTLFEIMAIPDFMNTLLMIQFFACMAVCAVSYALIAKIAFRQKQKYQNRQALSSNQWKITKMMATVVMLYILFYIPGVVIYAYMRYDKHNPEQYINYFRVFNAFYLLSSLVNPILYARKSSYYRLAFKNILPSMFSRRVMSNSVDVTSFTP